MPRRSYADGAADRESDEIGERRHRLAGHMAAKLRHRCYHRAQRRLSYSLCQPFDCIGLARQEGEGRGEDRCSGSGVGWGVSALRGLAEQDAERSDGDVEVGRSQKSDVIGQRLEVRSQQLTVSRRK